MENKIKVWFYPDDNSANAAMVQYISSHTIVDTQWTDFWNDRGDLDFSFIGMDDPGDWYGGMMGVQLTADSGECVIFASWIDPDDCADESDEYFDRLMMAFCR